ncbi:hypothetical protein [Actinacidiphila yeochonensis]|uniref:hypothetical protein n=1 Tax=Actinacidiphila yeochonensis TaxID=89050 RepID=UPI00055FAD68|nr:hypothetical protein [Actinacidiphila yeochonensis]
MSTEKQSESVAAAPAAETDHTSSHHGHVTEAEPVAAETTVTEAAATTQSGGIKPLNQFNDSAPKG